MFELGKSVFFLILVSLVVFFVSSPSSWAMELFPGLHKMSLSNGLTAIVKESHRAPVVAVQVWVKAGSAYESDEEAGITHLIEHMIFKGTEKRGPGEIARAIESVGGTINAYTSLDYTVYHCVVPSQYLSTALDVLSDAVFHSVFDPKELEREKKVVLEEIRMRDDRPQARLSTLLMSTSYKVYPYKRPVIGYPETVRSFTREDILAYMSRWYHPDNMAVVVAGDVEPSKALAAINDTFGKAAKAETKPPRWPIEPVQASPRIGADAMQVQEGYLSVAFSGLPSFNTPDVPALDVLAALLGSGESSRLTLTLKDKLQLVHSINASAFTPAGPGLFEIWATLSPENTKQALSKIFEELYRLQDEDVLDEELQKAKIQVETSFVYSQEAMEGEAQKIGLFQTLAGDPYAEKIYLEKVREVTAEDIKKLAKKIFQKTNINVAMVMPEDQAPALSLDDIVLIAQEAEVTAKGLEPAEPGALVHPIRRTTLDNGLTVLVRKVPDVPTVAVKLVFPGGVRYETEDTNGIFHFLAQMWTRGTEIHSAQGLAEIIEGMGGSIRGFSGQNTFGLDGRFLSQNLDKGLELFAEVLLTPSFPSEEIEKLRPLILAQLKRQDDYLPGVAIREFRRLLFSPHPYGMNPIGRPEVIEKITSDDLKATYVRYSVPEQAVLSIVGDVNPNEILSTLETLLGGWRADTESVLPEPPAPEFLSAPRFLSLKREKQQVHIVLGFPGTTFTSSDRYPLEVMNAILSGQGGRLFADLRDKQSLAYSVTSFVGLGLDYGSFAFYIACAPEKRDRALKGLWREIYRIREEAVSQEELARAKRWLVGNYQIGLQTNGAQALDMALNELYGLGFNFSVRYVQEIDKVTPEQVEEIAQKILSPDAYVLVRVGP